MKNRDILKLYETLNRLMMDSDKKFSVRLGFMLMKNRALIESDAKLIMEMRNKLLRQYGELQENGDIVIAKDKVDEIQKKLDDLMDIDVDMVLAQVPIEEFEEIELPLDDINGLSPLIMDFMYTSGPIFENEKTEE